MMLVRPRAQQLLTSRAAQEARGLPHLRTFARVFGQGDLLGDAEVIRLRGSLEPGSAVEGDSYSLRLVIKGLDAMGTTYKQSKLGGVDMFVRTGCHVPLGDGHLSIQTHPWVAQQTFAETMILRVSAFQQADLDALGYGEGLQCIQRWDTPEELLAHVREALRYYAAKTGQGAASKGGQAAGGKGPGDSTSAPPGQAP